MNAIFVWGGQCRATSIGECSKKCKFFTVPISKYKEKTVKVYESKQEEVNKLHEEVNKLQEKIKVLEKENCELKKQLESWQEEHETDQDHK